MIRIDKINHYGDEDSITFKENLANHLHVWQLRRELWFTTEITVYYEGCEPIRVPKSEMPRFK